MSDFIKEGDEILAIDDVEVAGKFYIEADTYFHFDLTIDTVLTMACAITLDPVRVPIHVEVTETFSENKDDDCHLVEGITVDLSSIIWSNIYLEKPMRVVSKGASFESDEPTKDDTHINPAFEALKKYKE